ncbi:unnamed protein product [Rotaria sp. Silwood1]|nr:unnamed protein product [Rotaria sp. Silwood1]
MKKIQLAAENVRTDLKQILESLNNQILKTCRNVASKLLSAREAENFSEIDLKRWTEQLNELKSQIKLLFMIHIVEDNKSPVYLIEIKQTNNVNAYIKNKELLSFKRIEERFIEGNGLAIIEYGGLRIKHIDGDHKFIYFRGQKSYTNGCHTLQFKIEHSTGSYDTFIGICSSDINLRQIMYHLTVVASWFNTTEVWLHGRRIKNTKRQGSKNDEIKTNDIIQLTIDSCPAQSSLITFDDIITTTSISGIPVPSGYNRLNWQNVLVVNGVNYFTPNTGYTTGVVSSPYLVFNGYGNPMAITNMATSTFTINSFYSCAAWHDNTVLTMIGTRSGTVLYTKKVELFTEKRTFVELNWSGIDSINFNSSCGSCDASHVTMDNLCVTF